MPRLPRPGSDTGAWGELLNNFLGYEHNSDGTHKTTVAPVQSVAGRVGQVTLTKSDIANLASDLAVRPLSRGSWVAQTAYALNDIVVAHGAAWRCKTAHTSSNVFQSQVASGFWEQWGQRQTWVNIMDPPYGAKVDGSNNDAAALQAAIDAVSLVGGGTIYIPAGYCMVGSTIVLKKHVWLRGAGMFGSTLKLLPGANCTVIKNYVSSNGIEANADFCGIFDLTIDGNKASQGSGNYHGIQFATNPLTTAATNDSFFDMHHTVQNVRVYKPKGDGISLSGRSETRLENTYVAFPDGRGIVTSFDTHLNNCAIEGSGLEGISIQNGSVRVVNSKVWAAGQVAASSGCGFRVTSPGGVSITNCEAQNNLAQGFLLENTSRITLSGVVADSNNLSNNGYAGIELANTHYSVLHAIAMQGTQNGIQIGHQDNALKLSNGANNNTIEMSHSAISPATIGPFAPSGTSYLDNFIIANGSVLSTSGGGVVADATDTAKGVVQLTGDLSGTASAPTVPTKVSKAGDSMTGSLTVKGTASQIIFDTKTTSSGNALTIDQFGNTTAYQKLAVGGLNAPSILSVNGSLGFGSVTTTTTNLTLSTSHAIVLANATSGPLTITLPAVSGVGGRLYFIKKSDATSNSVTVSTTSGQPLDSTQTSLSLLYQNDYLLLACDSSAGWRVFGASIVTAPLTVKGSITTSIVTKATNYTLTASDATVLADTSSSGISLTLPTAVNCPGRHHTIKDWKGTAATHAILVTTTNGQTIDSTATQNITQNFGYATYVSDGANWVTVT